MRPIALSAIALAFVLGGALLGMYLRRALPTRHLSSDTKDVVRLGAGLISSITALVLALLVNSARDSSDSQNTEVRRIVTDVILLDNLLILYGPETRETRDLMRRSIGELADRVWHQEGIPIDTSGVRDTFYSRILALSPQNDAQRAIKDRAVAASFDLGQARLLLFTHIGNGISMPFLAVLVFWLAVIFASFSLFAPPNPVVVISLLLFALSAATAIFLILQLADPFTGLMQISSEPLRHALTPLDR
jgi:hypothetical protein